MVAPPVEGKQGADLASFLLAISGILRRSDAYGKTDIQGN